MKKRFCLLLFLFCFLLSGCGIFSERIKEPVTFYYIRQDYQHFTQSDVIVPEVREASGHRDDLSYLLALYVMGPIGEDLRSPLPRGNTVHAIHFSENSLILQLTNMDLTLSDTEFSLVCACLSMTCMELTSIPQVTIHSGERTMTLNRDSLVFVDNSVLIEEELP